MENKVLGCFANLNILSVCWFTSRLGTVGIVKVQDKYEGLKYYIGVVDGHNETQDINNIVLFGNKFPEQAARAMEIYFLCIK